MRHAKAGSTGDTDFARELTRTGHRDAVAAGRWLASAGFVPEAALVSAARRTHETWEGLAEGGGWDTPADFSDALYGAGVDSALDLVREIADEVRTVVVVGHNPTMAQLAQLLDDGEGDPDSVDQMAVGFPTAALARFEYAGSWADIAFGDGRLVGYHVGRSG
jgi:phosphohistidine phosphatase